MTNKYVGLNPFIMCDLLDKMILPILTYGCEVWGYHKGDAIERVHREFLKGLLKMKSTTSLYMESLDVSHEYIRGILGL